MGRRFRRALVPVTSALFTLGTALLLTQFTGKGLNFGHFAGWVAIGGLVLSLAALGFALPRTSKRPYITLAPGEAESRLAQPLTEEVRQRRSVVVGPDAGLHLIGLRFDKVTFNRDSGGDATGDLSRIAGYLESLAGRRLVILGGPGSGKTVLALELQGQILGLRERDATAPLPVLVNASSYSPGRPWGTWLISHLAERYLLGEDAAATLVSHGRILPIVDGLDELERSSAASLLRELEGSPYDRGAVGPPVVITCRDGEYRDLDRPLEDATHVVVRPLTSTDVGRYAEQSGIQIPSEVASVLTTPLMLSIYGGAAGSGQSMDELAQLPDETAVERRLLAMFLANAYREIRRGGRWSLGRAEGWLAFIGAQMRALATEGYSWRQTTEAMPSWLVGLLGGVATGLALSITFAILGITHQVFGDRVPLGTAIAALAAVSIGPAILTVALVAGANYAGRRLGGLNIAYAALLVASLTVLAPRPSLLPLQLIIKAMTGNKGNPRADLSRSRKSALTGAVVVGLPLWVLVIALRLVGVKVPWEWALVTVCWCAVTTVLCFPWGSYQLARVWFSARGRLPYRLLDFFDDATERGVLRSAGSRFEFRNAAVRGYFSNPDRIPAIRRVIDELTGWALGNPEIGESYQYVGANRDDIDQAVSSVANEAILAGSSFTADAATRQAVLERVRVRLNELVRKSAFDESLVAREAPGLGAVVDPSRVIPTKTMDEIDRLIVRLPSASVGISGIRGIGKSTLIRWLCSDSDGSRRLPGLGLYVTAPVEYEARDFLVHLYITLCKAVLADSRFADRRARHNQYQWRVAVILGLALAGIGVYYHQAVRTDWAHHQLNAWSTIASLLFTAALFFLTSIISYARHRHGNQSTTSLATVAAGRLRRLRYQVVQTTGETGNLTGPFGLSFGASHSRQVTENQMTLPELVDDYRDFASLTVSALQDMALRDGPLASAQVRLVVGIDEIDRIEDAENAEKFLNDIKAIFGIPNCFYVASLSADALANFERRVVSTRTAFDTTFDTVMRIGPIELETARQVLERRAIGLPYPFIALCYVLSGGVPRELMRIARGIFEVRNESDESVSCSVIAPRVIRREMESLRQGLMPLATQLNVPGAADLIALLDDEEWPRGDMLADMDRLTGIIGKRSLFQDETGGVKAAARICDGLAAASYFFLTANQLFGTRLDQVVTDLRRYDAAPGRDADLASSIHLLARARAAIGVNPALAVSRVQTVRSNYGLGDVSLVLLSQVAPDLPLWFTVSSLGESGR